MLRFSPLLVFAVFFSTPAFAVKGTCQQLLNGISTQLGVYRSDPFQIDITRPAKVGRYTNDASSFQGSHWSGKWEFSGRLYATYVVWDPLPSSEEFLNAVQTEEFNISVIDLGNQIAIVTPNHAFVLTESSGVWNFDVETVPTEQLTDRALEIAKGGTKRAVVNGIRWKAEPAWLEAFEASLRDTSSAPVNLNPEGIGFRVAEGKEPQRIQLLGTTDPYSLEARERRRESLWQGTAAAAAVLAALWYIANWP